MVSNLWVPLNKLPPDHTREDFDFTFRDGSVGPIRINAYVVDRTSFPATVWCIKHHTWEVEEL